MKRRVTTSVALLMLAVLILSGFGAGSVALAAGPAHIPASGPATAAAPTDNVEVQPAPALTPKQLSAADIFALVSPAVAFIETPAATGSGVLIADGYVVTNAHVVWPFKEVRVVFPDGTEYLNAPVANWDLMADLAIVGPIESSISPVALVDGEDLVVGSEAFLIGYPGETDQFPQPTFTRGLISRLREWTTIEMTYFQTDALIAGGQSGGVLVSEMGEVIGISGFSFTEAGFGLVASAADVSPRIDRLMAGEDAAGLGDRFLPVSDGIFEDAGVLETNWDTHVYVIDEPAGTEVSIEVVGENDLIFGLYDPFGNVTLVADNDVSGTESGSVTIDYVGPHFLIVAQFNVGPGEFYLNSNTRLVPLEDADDGVSLSVGQTVQGNTDYRGDMDYFVIDLAEGETVSISVDSVMIDPVLYVDFPTATDEQVISVDDSGAGVFGQNAELVYQAPHSGTYFLVVQDAYGFNVGGYFLTVDQAAPDATPIIVPQSSASAPSSEPTVPMVWYESVQYPFVIQIPAQWVEQPAEEDVTATYAADEGALFIAEEDLSAADGGQMTLDEYVDIILRMLEQNENVSKIVSSERMVSAQGLPIHVIEGLVGPDGQLSFSRMIYVHEGSTAFNVTYLVSKHQLESLINSSFNSFSVEETGTADAAARLDQGITYYEQEDYDQAIAEFQEAIRLDPEFGVAYGWLGYSYALGPGALEEAIAALETYLQLVPDAGNRTEVEADIRQMRESLTAASAGFEVPPGQALFVFTNYTDVDWSIDVGPYHVDVPAWQGGEYPVGTIVIEPGAYVWQAHSPGGGYYITDANGNTAFEFSIAAGEMYETDVR